MLQCVFGTVYSNIIKESPLYTLYIIQQHGTKTHGLSRVVRQYFCFSPGASLIIYPSQTHNFTSFLSQTTSLMSYPTFIRPKFTFPSHFCLKSSTSPRNKNQSIWIYITMNTIPFFRGFSEMVNASIDDLLFKGDYSEGMRVHTTTQHYYTHLYNI